MTILIDPGHGNNTAGKRSPDGSFLEYSFNREIAHRLCCAINSLPYLNSLTSPTSLTLSAQVIVPELEDISLRERCNRVNEICRTIGTENVLLISIHAMQQAMDRSGARLPDGAATPALAIQRQMLLPMPSTQLHARTSLPGASAPTIPMEMPTGKRTSTF